MLFKRACTGRMGDKLNTIKQKKRKDILPKKGLLDMRCGVRNGAISELKERNGKTPRTSKTKTKLVQRRVGLPKRIKTPIRWIVRGGVRKGEIDSISLKCLHLVQKGSINEGLTWGKF